MACLSSVQKNEDLERMMNHHWDGLTPRKVYPLTKQTWDPFSDGSFVENSSWMASHEPVQDDEHLAKLMDHPLPLNGACLKLRKISPLAKWEKGLVCCGYVVENCSPMTSYPIVQEDEHLAYSLQDCIW
jgi:hypothetical protein